MKNIIILLTITALAYIFAYLTFGRKTKKNFITEYIFFSGIIYIIFGFLVGEGAFGIIKGKTFENISPILSLVLCWAGFIFGYQFRVRRLKYISVNYYIGAVLQGILTFLVLLIIIVPVVFFIVKIKLNIYSAFAIAACVCIGSGTSPSSIGFITRHFNPSGKYRNFIEFISGFDSIIVIIGIGLIFSIFHISAFTGKTYFVSILWIFIAIGLGIAFGVFTELLTKKRKKGENVDITIIGILLLSSGVASYLQISSIFVGFIAGIYLTNRHNVNHTKIFSFVLHTEKPFFIILMFFAGMLVRFKSYYLIIIIPAFIIARIIGKVISFLLVRKMYKRDGLRKTLTGSTLLSQGEFAICVILELYIAYQKYFNKVKNIYLDVLLTVVIISTVFFQILSPIIIKYFLKKENEICTKQ